MRKEIDRKGEDKIRRERQRKDQGETQSRYTRGKSHWERDKGEVKAEERQKGRAKLRETEKARQ